VAPGGDASRAAAGHVEPDGWLILWAYDMIFVEMCGQGGGGGHSIMDWLEAPPRPVGPQMGSMQAETASRRVPVRPGGLQHSAAGLP
jgi:hypothetical protein